MAIPRFWPRTLRWRVFLLVSGLLLLLLITAIATTVSRVHVTEADSRVRDTLRPAQTAAADLAKGYVDMETGERGFLLSRDPQFLEPYDNGSAAVGAARDRIARLLDGEPESVALLADVDAAGTAWRTQAADPAIALARADGVIADGVPGKALFDTLRTRIAELQNHVDELISAGLASSNRASGTADVIATVCVGLALVLGAASVFLLRRSLVVPLDRLVSQVREVSGGDLRREVEASGPEELAALGEAVEAMRTRILSEAEQVAAASNRIARLEETDRIARRLGDTAIRRLYGITLDLQSAAARFPRSGSAMATAITGIDRTISALRTSVYGPAAPGTRPTLRAQVSEVVGELESVHGSAPGLVLAGDLDDEPPDDVVAEVVQVLRDLLHAVAVPGGGAEEVELAPARGAIRLRVVGAVSDDQVAALRAAVAEVSGDAVVRPAPGHFTVEWSRPLRPDS
ncbi:CHASE3 domain-containing protein [Amycolatopsis thermophila]|uniref:CHASE3 domain sensor protein n=1 Tax=Amycolatopsis thermophila TaxID=206084 RepID=A0ABU0EWR5_9PSEU|nr:CHASE3 domain-containing protein [Amycolatopsis thermophila]MDQ0379742.1 CHASE3 domain sensor protein [Amycolatopsis thermophila]